MKITLPFSRICNIATLTGGLLIGGTLAGCEQSSAVADAIYLKKCTEQALDILPENKRPMTDKISYSHESGQCTAMYNDQDNFSWSPK